MLAEMDTIYHTIRKDAWVSCHFGGVARLQSAKNLINTLFALKGLCGVLLTSKGENKALPSPPAPSNVVPLNGLTGRGEDYFSLLSASFEDSVSQRKGKQF